MDTEPVKQFCQVVERELDLFFETLDRHASQCRVTDAEAADVLYRYAGAELAEAYVDWQGGGDD